MNMTEAICLSREPVSVYKIPGYFIHGYSIPGYFISEYSYPCNFIPGH